MCSGLEVVAHPTGPWLVRAGRVVYAVPADLGRPLLRWQGRWPSPAELTEGPVPAAVDPAQWRVFMSALAAALAGPAAAGVESRPGQRCPPAVWLRLPLLPAGLVRRLARHLAVATGRCGAGALFVIGVAGYLHLGWTTGAAPITLHPGEGLVALALFLLTALAHELGHAAALAREGYPPGGIGAGLLFVVPVLYADVTAAGALPRRGRLRVDLAGVAVQFGCGGGLGLIAGATGSVPAAVAAWLALGAIAWSLQPFIRSDGYWALADLLEVPGLESGPLPAGGRWRRGFLRAYRCGNALFLVLIGLVVPLKAIPLLGGVLARGGWPVPAWLPAALAAPVLVLVWRNLARRVALLVRAAWRPGTIPTDGTAGTGRGRPDGV